MIENYLEHIFDSVDSSIHLDEEQKQVVKENGDLLVIAGAGSGKTTTMVAKVKYLVEIEKVSPKEILMISYTNKATEELMERIQKQMQLSIDILTFHKFGLQILKSQKSVHVKANSKEVVQKVLEAMVLEKHWKQFLFFHARKYYVKKDMTKLIELCTHFIAGYKRKGRPTFKNLHLNKIWNHFFEEVIDRYDSFMEQQQFIDFEDMILFATKIILESEINFPYRYIIVDEYQDISNDRFQLLYAIKKKYPCHIIAVGDDWQSIFGFSGSEIALFTQFKIYFPEAKVFKITNTYRNSQELIDMVGSFVMKNSFQIQKQLISRKHLDYPIILLPWLFGKEKKLESVLSYISKLRNHSIVFLLGRYHQDFDIKEYRFLELKNEKIYAPKYSNLTIEFLTIHSAKGLGADEVILLNLETGTYGFPTRKKTNFLLNSVASVDTSYCYAEERRLFYVALTRTKNHVFLLYPIKNQSIFIRELKKANKNKIISF